MTISATASGFGIRRSTPFGGSTPSNRSARTSFGSSSDVVAHRAVIAPLARYANGHCIPFPNAATFGPSDLRQSSRCDPRAAPRISASSDRAHLHAIATADDQGEHACPCGAAACPARRDATRLSAMICREYLRASKPSSIRKAGATRRATNATPFLVARPHEGSRVTYCCRRDVSVPHAVHTAAAAPASRARPGSPFVGLGARDHLEGPDCILEM
jgi:hypothetical protein